MRIGMYRYLTQYVEEGYGKTRERIFQILAQDLELLDAYGTGKIVGRAMHFDTLTYFYELKVYRYRVMDAIVVRNVERFKEIYEKWNG